MYLANLVYPKRGCLLKSQTQLKFTPPVRPNTQMIISIIHQISNAIIIIENEFLISKIFLLGLFIWLFALPLDFFANVLMSLIQL
jgi:hypothetical protein